MMASTPLCAAQLIEQANRIFDIGYAYEDLQEGDFVIVKEIPTSTHSHANRFEAVSNPFGVIPFSSIQLTNVDRGTSTTMFPAVFRVIGTLKRGNDKLVAVQLPIGDQNAVQTLKSHGVTVREGEYGAPAWISASVMEDNIEFLRVGSRNRLFSALSSIINHPIEFTPGEPVRYRDKSGLIAYGTFSEPGRSERVALITTTKGEKVEVSRREIFKSLPNARDEYLYRPTEGGEVLGLGAAAYTPQLRLPLSQAMRDLLNATAKITSLDEYQALSSREKLRLLLDLYLAVVTPHESARYLEQTVNLTDIGESPAIGVVTCRNNPVNFGLMLSESGFTYQTARLPRSAEDSAHIWILVTGEGAASWEPLHVDPNVLIDSDSGGQTKGLIATDAEIRAWETLSGLPHLSETITFEQPVRLR